MIEASDGYDQRSGRVGEDITVVIACIDVDIIVVIIGISIVNEVIDIILFIHIVEFIDDYY